MDLQSEGRSGADDQNELRPAAQLWTDYDGLITETTDDAAELLNISPLLLQPCFVYRFFISGGREALQLIDNAACGRACDLEVRIQPLNQRIVTVRLWVDPERDGYKLIRWSFALQEIPETRFR